MSAVRARHRPPFTDTEGASGVRVSGTEANESLNYLLGNSKPESSAKFVKSSSFFRKSLSVTDVADMLGKSVSTITRWCQTGQILAIPRQYGKKVTYDIPVEALSLLQLQTEIEIPKVAKPKATLSNDHRAFLAPWKIAMETGTLNGKVYSPRTVEEYVKYTDQFFKLHTVLSFASVKAELSKITPSKFATREKYYKALLCLGKFLIQEKAMTEEFITEIKQLCPKPLTTPKRAVVDEQEVNTLLAFCTEIEDKLVVTLLICSGLRASEACSLTWEDIDLNRGNLSVLGKGGKRRRVGINSRLIDVLNEYRASISKPKGSDFLLVNRLGYQMDRNGLYQRLQRICERAKVTASPHALRRAFVTINANKGRPLQMLQIACGHSDIKTTMSYCRTTEQEVIDAMKGWD